MKLLIGIALLCGSLNAGTIYTYTGAADPFLSITLDMTLEGASLDNLSNSNISDSITSYSFSDEFGDVITQANDPSVFTATLSTNSVGDPTEWIFAVTEILDVSSDYVDGRIWQYNGYIDIAIDSAGNLNTFSPGNTNSSDMAGEWSATNPGNVKTIDYGVDYNQPGTWTVTNAPASTIPEPTTLGMFGVGLLSLLSSRFRKKPDD